MKPGGSLTTRGNWRGLLIFLFALGLVTVGPLALGDVSPAHADPGIRYVATTGSDAGIDCADPGSPCRTIQHAVDQADDYDEIRVAAGTYTGVNGLGGLFQVVYITRPISLEGGYSADWSERDPYAHVTTVDAEGAGRGICAVGSAALTIEGLRVTGGNATGLGDIPWWHDAGGGIYVSGSTVTISDCVISGNVADFLGRGYGGGVSLQDSTSQLISTTISGNVAGYFLKGYGGGVHVSGGSLTLTGNEIADNLACLLDKGYGGGVWSDAPTASLVGNAIWDNFASKGKQGEGGGLHIAGGTVSDNEVVGNVASTAHNGQGGGMYLSGAPEVSRNLVAENVASVVKNGQGGGVYGVVGSMDLEANFIQDNVASTADDGSGGGVYLQGCDLYLINNVVNGNQARGAGKGAGVYLAVGVEDLSSDLLHNTVVANAGGDGSGIHLSRTGATSAPVAMTNNVVVSQTVGVASEGGLEANLDSTLWWGNVADWSGAGVATVRDHWGDPAFVDPAGGDYHVGMTSYAIDRGVEAGVGSDIDGQARPLGDGPDLGADEYPLSLRKTAEDLNGAPLYVGDQVRYVITVTNHDAGPMTGVAVTDTLPAGVELVSASPSGYMGPNPLVWDVGTIAGGEAWAATVLVRVDGSQGTVGGNVASMASDQGGEETDPVAPPAGGGIEAGLVIQKTAEDLSGAPLYVGDLIRYVITATNASTATTMTGVTLTDTLPSGVEFVSATPEDYAGPNPLVWEVGAMDPGEQWIAVVTVRVDGSQSPVGGNVAAVGGDQQGRQETEPALPPGGGEVLAALAIEKTAEDLNGAPLYPGDLIRYVVTVTNHGVDPMTGVAVTDTLPAGVELVGATPSGYTGPDPMVWTVGTLAGGEAWTATITAWVSGEASPIAGNVAEVASDQAGPRATDPALPPAGGEVMAGLKISKSGEDMDGEPLYTNDLVQYTITVTNESTTTAMTGVVVRDTLPAGVEFVSATPGGYTGPNPLVWIVGALDPGQVWKATITARATGGPVGPNMALVDSDQQNQQASEPAWPGPGQSPSPELRELYLPMVGKTF